MRSEMMREMGGKKKKRKGKKGKGKKGKGARKIGGRKPTLKTPPSPRKSVHTASTKPKKKQFINGLKPRKLRGKKGKKRGAKAAKPLEVIPEKAEIVEEPAAVHE